jgi:DNA-directed RNA polymerase subunit RPC12/RpoP
MATIIKPMNEEYTCIKCGEEWGFIPEDYDYAVENYPVICPHCEMPIHQMIREVLKEEGLKGIPYIVKIIVAKFTY